MSSSAPRQVCTVPDPLSCTVLPWQPDTAWFASNLDLIEGGGPFEACSRRILLKQQARAAASGYGFDVG